MNKKARSAFGVSKLALT